MHKIKESERVGKETWSYGYFSIGAGLVGNLSRVCSGGGNGSMVGRDKCLQVGIVYQTGGVIRHLKNYCP